MYSILEHIVWRNVNTCVEQFLTLEWSILVCVEQLLTLEYRDFTMQLLGVSLFMMYQVWQWSCVLELLVLVLVIVLCQCLCSCFCAPNA